MSAASEGSRTALFWKCRAPFDMLFKKTLLRFQRDSYRLPSGPNLQQRMFNRNSGLFEDGKRVEITEWRDGVEFAEHWDGLAFELQADQPVRVEFLRSEPAAVLMVTVSEETWHRQRSSSHFATRWAGVLLDFFHAAEAECCLFPINLDEVPCQKWAEAVALRRKTAELRIEKEPTAENPPSGYKTIKLTEGGILQTSLPVKSSPSG